MESRDSIKSIIVTGCSSGIGYHVARRLAGRGYQVFSTARKATDVKRLQEQGMTSLRLDLASEKSVQAAFDEVMEATGGELYAVFNNGAYGQPGAVEDLSRAALRKQFETNLFGTQQLTNLALKVMREQGYGRIIHNGSLLGLVALNYRGAYVATKFALEGLSDTLRLELRGSDIHVSLIEPGPVQSRFRQNAFQAFLKNIDRENSIHRAAYAAQEWRFKKEGAVAPGTLGPEAVYRKVLHALEHPRPKARYYVTWPTYVLASLKWLLPVAGMDRLMSHIGAGEQKHD